MSKPLEGYEEPLILESATGLVVLIAGGIVVTNIDQDIIGGDYNDLTEKLIPLQNQVDSLTEVKPLLVTEQGRNDIANVIATKKSEVHALTEARSHHHAPIGMGAEMITDGGLTFLAVLAVGSLQRAIYKRRHAKNSKPSPVEVMS